MNEICLSCKKHTKCGRAIHETIGCGYYAPLTEQEYIQTCNTEQLAEVLFSWYKLGRLDVINKHTELKKDWLIGWLKQPHNSPK